MAMDERVSLYIETAAPFARPILAHFRTLLHSSVPQAVETVKWGMPFFEVDRRPLAMMAAFKAHAGIGIFDGSPMATGSGMGQFGKLTSLADLPAAADLGQRLLKASQAIVEGKAVMRPKTGAKALPKSPAVVPDDLLAALNAAPAAAIAFAGFPPGARREYVDWVEGAKQLATRARRIATTVDWVSEGKRRNWKYEDC